MSKSDFAAIILSARHSSCKKDDLNLRYFIKRYIKMKSFNSIELFI